MGPAGTPLDHAEIIARLRLIRSENVGPVTFGHLLRRYGDASRALAALPELAAQGGLGRRIRIYGRAEAEAELEANHAIGARVIVRGMAEYPTLLEQCEDAPAVFSLRGHGHLLARPAVAMVGARNASANARRLAHALAETVAAKDYAVVSGMARGIDTAAHQGALSGGTVAVLGGGIDVIYPRENADLYDRLVEGGALVAESPIGTQPQARNFPARNRIIAGLSLAVVVVEAAERSGSLITARLAGELGREVMAVPGSPLNPRCRGSNQLLRDGAHLIETGDDIVAVVAGLGGRHVRAPLGAPFDGFEPRPPSPETLAAARREVIEFLNATPTAVDEIIRRCQFSAPVVLTVLLEAELAGTVERHPGNMVARRFTPRSGT